MSVASSSESVCGLIARALLYKRECFTAHLAFPEASMYPLPATFVNIHRRFHSSVVLKRPRQPILGYLFLGLYCTVLYPYCTTLPLRDDQYLLALPSLVQALYVNLTARRDRGRAEDPKQPGLLFEHSRPGRLEAPHSSSALSLSLSARPRESYYEYCRSTSRYLLVFSFLYPPGHS